MFKQRLLSGIVLVAIMAALLISGGYVLWLALIVISGMGMYELLKVFGIENKAIAWVTYLASCLYYTDLQSKYDEVDDYFIISLFVIILLTVYVFSFPKYNTKQVLAAFFAFFYVALMLSYIYRIRILDNGIYLVWLVLLCSWGSDTCAYCVGVLFGKHKMTPELSPKKSVEGAVGGVVGAILLTAIFALVFKDALALSNTQIAILSAVSGLGAIISMIGDLAASAIKRNYDIKDYGTIIPGHGGILDRFDSVIITAPVVYYCYTLFMI